MQINQPFRGAKTFRKLVQVMDLDTFEVDDLVIVRDCLGNALVRNVGVLDRGLDWIQDLLGGPVECVLYGTCVVVQIVQHKQKLEMYVYMYWSS